MNKNLPSRRSLLELGVRSLALAGAAAALPLRAQSAAGDRAAVCIFLVGGNDSNNMIVPYEDAVYNEYSRARGMLALSKSFLLPVSSARQKTTFGFHPSMPEVQRLYASGALAVLANEGALVRPTHKRDVLSRRAELPFNLFEHSGGDHLKYGPLASAFPPWALRAQQKSDDPADKGPQVFRLGGLSLMSPDRPKIEGSRRDNDLLMKAMDSVTVRTPFPETSIGEQLLKVVKLVKAAPKVGLTRPVFTVMMSGFDTHSLQMEAQPALFAELSQGLGAFYDGLREHALERNVTAFTHTEFNRTLAPNDRGGTEHAWGSHHLILGGSVLGGDVYGEFPAMELDGPHNIGSGGIFVPTTSGHEYLAQIADWHGTARGPEAATFPARDLAFLV